MADPGERIDVDDGTARIELRRRGTPSLWAIIDVEDLKKVRSHQWNPLVRKRATYAYAKVAAPDGRRVTLYLHRFLMEAGPGTEIDHVDHDGLNNRRSNLRFATRGGNLGNTRKLRGGTSQYKGVCWVISRRRWKAAIQVNGRTIHLGRYATELEAALAYDAAALAAWGEFACLNFPREDAA